MRGPLITAYRSFKSFHISNAILCPATLGCIEISIELNIQPHIVELLAPQAIYSGLCESVGLEISPLMKPCLCFPSRALRMALDQTS